MTISTGFVVDDAIVMIENIFRYIEQGDHLFEAALKGSKQIGFTVISLSISLIAVFITLLFMSGIVGRLFREFAITLSMAVAVSAFVSLTLTPMMCAKMLRREDEQHENAFQRFVERGFGMVLRLYDRSLGFVLRHQAAALIVAAATPWRQVSFMCLCRKVWFLSKTPGLSLASPTPPRNFLFRDAFASTGGYGCGYNRPGCRPGGGICRHRHRKFHAK